MLADLNNAGQVFEAGMMVLFGVSWPVAIYKTWRSKRTEGKSRAFLIMVIAGYLCGMVGKFLRAAADNAAVEPVVLLYGLNAILVCVDLLLVMHYRSRAERP